MKTLERILKKIQRAIEFEKQWNEPYSLKDFIPFYGVITGSGKKGNIPWVVYHALIGIGAGTLLSYKLFEKILK